MNRGAERDVQEHPDAVQLRSAGDQGRGARCVVAVRAEDQRLSHAVEGQRGGLRSGGGGDHTDIGTPTRVPRADPVPKESTGGGREGQGAGHAAFWLAAPAGRGRHEVTSYPCSPNAFRIPAWMRIAFPYA